jgi:hypothetical protein
VGLEGINELNETLGSDIGEFEDDCLLGCCVVLRGVCSSMIRAMGHRSDVGGSTYLRSDGNVMPDQTVPHHRRQSPSTKE